MLGFTLALLSLKVRANAGAHAEHALLRSVLDVNNSPNAQSVNVRSCCKWDHDETLQC